MLRILPAPITGVLAVTLYAVNLIIWTTMVQLLGLMRILLPVAAWRRFLYKIMHAIPPFWVAGNNLIMRLTTRTQWDIRGIEQLRKNEWYLMIANHQSWLDILVLKKVFDARVPMLKFFMKKQLLWVPFVGLPAWVLDFPFMQRYTSAFLAKHPHLKGKDLATTQKACEKFKHLPITVINFAEGTRFTQNKHDQQASPFQHLLMPRAGGTAFVLQAMNGYLQEIIDVTIIYPTATVSAWQFFCGKMHKIIVDIKTYPVTADLTGDYANDAQYRQYFQQWLNQRWQEKDQLIDTILEQQPV